VGHVTEQNLTYTEWYEEELVVVPGVPARVCDYCGEKEYDPFVVGTLRRLLWTNLDPSKKMTGSTRVRRHRFDLERLHNKDQFPPNE
jgi:YgiT-type zinc finger domain-containing protein